MGIILLKLDLKGMRRLFFYDGEVVSSKISRGFKSTHSFSVKEDGEDVSYEVKVGVKGLFSPLPGRIRPKIEVFRNGKKIYSSE
jgi:hypothetical protein